ncbi:uncharacterized protein LOC115244885 [Formica exsecta]|uniref:uncharacterized protein LOC115244885 n=1 Tax=Formica exsecta TaxID=72781 RepID=UPI0011429054|nr:uncharacterized protein LOC115244885 [Formica exsecta]
MNFSRIWCVIFVIAAACTCGVRTECGESAQISLLTSVHNDASCTKLSTKGVLLYEAAKLIAEIHNNKTDGYKIGITVFDTCGSITGALKAVMKALVWANVNCLHPPHYLGIIGPDSMTNAEAVHKVTSILKVSHIVRKPSISPYLHHLTEESNSYLIQGVLRMIEILKWKSFTLVANVNDENDDDVQNIAKKLTINSIAKNLCVIVHDNDEEDYTSHIVHIGKPRKKFFNESTNATILIISDGNLKDYLNSIKSTNTILLLEDSSYSKNRKCKNQINPLDWNHMVSNMLLTHNTESQKASRSLDLSVKTSTSNLKRLGSVIIRQNRAKVYWGDGKWDEKEKSYVEENEKSHATSESDDEDMPYTFRGFLNRENEPLTECATTVKEIKKLHEKDSETILVSGMDDNEWWTMVYTVSGVGIAMFLVGIFAVYIVYANINGPRCSKSKDYSDRDTSLRRMGSDRELPTTITTRNQRTSRMPQRTGSGRSTVSEKSV